MAFASTKTPLKPAARTSAATAAACSGGQIEITTSPRAASRVHRADVDEACRVGTSAGRIAAPGRDPEDLVIVGDQGRTECRSHRAGVEHADRHH